jgi:hypothetical protein
MIYLSFVMGILIVEQDAGIHHVVVDGVTLRE